MRELWNKRTADMTVKDWTKVTLAMTAITTAATAGVLWVSGRFIEARYNDLFNEPLESSPNEE